MPWYALHVRSNAERKVQELLRRQGIFEYLPLYEEKRRWSDRIQAVERPVFPGYLFAEFDPERNKRAVLSTAGVLRILGSPDPQPVDDGELDSIRRLVEAAAVLTPCAPAVGQKVIVTDGPLMGVIGTVQKLKGVCRVVVSVDLLGRAVAAEVDAESLAKA